MSVLTYDISLSASVEAHTNVESNFGNYSFITSKTDRVCKYSSSSHGSTYAVLNKHGRSTCSISESMIHESSEVLYLNNQENVMVYKHTLASLSFDISSTDFIINPVDGVWYNQFCKVVLKTTDIFSNRTDEIILVENGVPTILSTSVRDTANSDPTGVYAVFILDFPKYPMDETTYSIIMSDIDVKDAGGFWGDDLYFPKWCKDLIGSADPVWTYYDEKRSNALEMIP